MNHKDFVFEIKSVAETGVFSGYGSVYSVADDGDDVVAPGCFSESLADWATKGRMPALLWQHSSRDPIGAYTSMKEDSNGLFVEGKLALKTQRGAEAYELMQMKAISGLSIGFLTREDSYDQKTGIRTIKKADLWECSVVTFPMNDQARISAVKSIDEISDFKSACTYLRNACGCSRTEATAIVARLKSLTLRNAEEEAEAKQVLELLERHRKLRQPA
jgi:HK97 family phage prohead protease